MAATWAGHRQAALGARGVVNVAHRGASRYAPEHTIASYDLALQLGADYIEQDVHMTADGALVIMHDATLDRTALGRDGSATGPVAHKTLDELRRCDVGSWFNQEFPHFARPEYALMTVPSLDEVFTRYGKTANYYIETKHPESYPGIEEELVRLITGHGLAGRPEATPWGVVVQSFSPVSLRRVHELAPALPLIQLFSVQDSASVQANLAEVRSYASGIGVFKTSVDHGLVAAAHACDLCIHAYTVNDQRAMKRLVGFGVDGVFTDLPDRLDDVLHARRTRKRATLG